VPGPRTSVSVAFQGRKTAPSSAVCPGARVCCLGVWPPHGRLPLSPFVFKNLKVELVMRCGHPNLTASHHVYGIIGCSVLPVMWGSVRRTPCLRKVLPVAGDGAPRTPACRVCCCDTDEPAVGPVPNTAGNMEKGHKLVAACSTGSPLVCSFPDSTKGWHHPNPNPRRRRCLHLSGLPGSAWAGLTGTPGCFTDSNAMPNAPCRCILACPRAQCHSTEHLVAAAQQL
jgi:hypothetical protein